MNLEDCQKEYDKLEKTIEDDINLKGDKLEPALTSQPSLQRVWGILAANVAVLYKDVEREVDEAAGHAYVAAQSDNYKSRNSTDAKHFVDQDPAYNDAIRKKNKIYRLKKQIDSVCDVIESRKYVLKDLTASIINQVNNTKLI